jgi:hypothetical protein
MRDSPAGIYHLAAAHCHQPIQRLLQCLQCRYLQSNLLMGTPAVERGGLRGDIRTLQTPDQVLALRQ